MVNGKVQANADLPKEIRFYRGFNDFQLIVRFLIVLLRAGLIIRLWTPGSYRKAWI